MSLQSLKNALGPSLLGFSYVVPITTALVALSVWIWDNVHYFLPIVGLVLILLMRHVQKNSFMSVLAGGLFGIVFGIFLGDFVGPDHRFEFIYYHD